MSDQNKDKKTTQPSLLFKTPSEGLAPQLIPVPATASLFPEEDGEHDSFLGQAMDASGPPTTSVSPFSLFQQQPADHRPQPSAPAADPFAQVSQTQMAPPSQPPPIAQASNYFNTPPAPQPGPPPTSQFQSQPFQSPRPPQPLPPSVRPLDHRPPTSGGYAPGYPAPPLGQEGPPPTQPSGMVPPLGSPTQPGGGIAPPPVQGFQPRTPFDPSKPMSTAAQVSMQAGGEVPTSVQTQYMIYTPVQPHWFYCVEIEQRHLWRPFTMADSIKLEEDYHTAQKTGENVMLSTNGGRYDINLNERTRNPVYWQEEPSQIRRCTWFHKGDDEKFVPYSEDMAEQLESEYKKAVTANEWHRRLEFSGGQTIIMHNPNVIVHYRPSSQPDEWGTIVDNQIRPRVVKRGVNDVDNIEEGEPTQIDHLVFVVHGIGPICDLRFRSITECVDDFRSMSQGLVDTHFRGSNSSRPVVTGRVEFLPISWHSILHSEATGVDRRLKTITLDSIGRLRHFTNETLLDILFYTSPAYCQTIAERVGNEINRLYHLFCQRNPNYQGKISIVGHSLGSLICFDLLYHQSPPGQAGASKTGQAAAGTAPQGGDESQLEWEDELGLDASSEHSTEGSTSTAGEAATLESALTKLGLLDYLGTFEKEKLDMESLLLCSESDIKEMGLPMGPRKKLQGFLKAQGEKAERKRQEDEARAKMEAQKAAAVKESGSSTSLHIDYQPTLSGTGQPIVNYPQLDFEVSCMFAIGSPIGMFLTVRGMEKLGEDYKLPTCHAFYNVFHPFDPIAYRIEPLVNPSIKLPPVLMPHHKGRKRLHLELKDNLKTWGADLKRNLIDSMRKTWATLHQFAKAHQSEPTEEEIEAMAEQVSRSQQEEESGSERESVDGGEALYSFGQLNRSRRIDYVLQEKPIESFNEYLFALGSHACYWESEDTVLLLLKEIYGSPNYLPVHLGSSTSMS